MKKLHHIQALRGLAASLVVIDHAGAGMVGQDIGLGFVVSDQMCWAVGDVGVFIFFVISGFIMASTSYDGFGSLRGSLNFASKRLIRIAPLYWCATLLSFAIVRARGAAAPLKALLLSLGFVPFVASSGVMRPILGPGWTLNYEMFFYLVFALGLLLPRRAGFALILAAMVADVVAGALIFGSFSRAQPMGILDFWSDKLVLLFVFGILIALYEKTGGPRRALPGGLAALLGLTLLILAATVLTDYRNGGGVVSFLLLALACAMVVWLASMAEQARIGRLEAMIEALGDASFSTYLFHLFVLAQLGKVLKLLPFLPGWADLCLCVAVCNLAGLVIYRLLERPMTNRLRRWVIPA